MLFRTDYTIYTLSVFDRVRVRVRFNVQIKYSTSMIFKNSLSTSLLVRELSIIESATDCYVFLRHIILFLFIPVSLTQPSHTVT